MLYNRNGSDIVHYVINIGTSMYNIYENVFKARPLTDNLKYIYSWRDSNSQSPA